MDSRGWNKLTINSAKGAWPTTVMPYQQFKKEDLCDFDEWWTNQPFNIVFADIQFTRQELIEAIRHKEGGGHVDSLTSKKLATVRRNRSGWQKSIEEKEDGTTEMYIGFSLSNEPIAQDSNLEEISDYELASVCAIAKEILFSLSPEPENRLRMHIKDFQNLFTSQVKKAINVKKI